MTQRIDADLHRELSRYPIFQSSLPRHPSPLQPPPLRPLPPMSSLDEAVSRQVATFPIFQQSNGAQQPISTTTRSTEEPPSITMRSLEELRLEVARISMFQNSNGYRPTGLPGRETPGFMTPPPVYEHAPEYEREFEWVATQGGDVPTDQADNVSDEGSTSLLPSGLPPAYVRGEQRA